MSRRAGWCSEQQPVREVCLDQEFGLRVKGSKVYLKGFTEEGDNDFSFLLFGENLCYYIYAT